MLSYSFRRQLALQVHQAGIGISSPCKTARGHCEASVNCTKVLAKSLLDGTDLDTAREFGSSDTTNTHTAAAEETLATLLAHANPAAKCHATRAKSAGVKVLVAHEKEKKDKYEDSLARRRHFTPLVFSVDGLRGVEATAAGNRLAVMLSFKWNRSFPDVLWG